MVSLAEAPCLLDKADGLSPAAEKQKQNKKTTKPPHINGPSFVKQTPCMNKQTPSKFMLIRWRLGHLEWSWKDRIWRMCELTLIWLFLFSICIFHEKTLAWYHFAGFNLVYRVYSSKHSIWVIGIALILPLQVSNFLVPVACIGN